MAENTTEANENASQRDVGTELSRDMSLWDITFIGIGAMIGAGVFALTGFAAGLAGPALMLAFLLNGVVATFTAMSYAELGASFPQSGGAYSWVTEALPSPYGFYTGWANWFAQAVACALYAVTFGVFLTEFISVYTGLGHEFVFFGFLTRGLTERLLAGLVIALFAYINYRGAEETGTIGIVITTAKIIILGVFVIFGALATFKQPDWSTKFLSSPRFAPAGIGGIMAAMGFTYVAFEGYDIIVQSGEEVMDPGTNIPKAIFYSIAVVIPIYILVAFASIGGIEITDNILRLANMSRASGPVYTWQILGNLGELGIIQAAGQFVPYGLSLLLVAGLAATMSALNATLYASSRIGFAMARDNLLPPKLSDIHEEKRSPYLSIGVSGAIIMLMALTLPIESVAASSSVMFILLFSMVNIAAIAMRRNRPNLERPFEIPFMPWIPILGIVFQLLLTPFLLTSLGLRPWEDGFTALVTMAAWFAIGIAVWYAYSEEKEMEKLEQETPTVVSHRATERRDYQLVVPIANPENADQLMQTAIDLARENDGEILVTSVVTVSPQTPLSQGRQFVTDEKENVLSRAIQIGEDADVPVSGTIRIGHDVADAILNTIDQHDSTAVLLGWQGGDQARRRDIVLGSTVDRIAQDAQADVLVERIGESASSDIDSILVPMAGGPHAEYATTIAEAIARPENARVEILHIISPDASESDRQEAQELVNGAAEEFDADGEVETAVIESDDVSNAILEHSADFDLTVIGATREGLLEQIVFGAVPEEIARRSENIVIMAKKNLGITSLIQRWL
ncbi:MULTISPECIES: amino acid permease [unclassified Haladaptatus]|uniref:amino acid permease n=1 Tax=unclassified Haladaptatus TaxID=2622732 RepID=UPI00209C4CDE|nr:MULTISPECIES: amino acid permease [unclassified Haladaptatus]MCO8245951.1 amino acid permease [Haladaptatus sp. AB643]MCO8254429.1 amino acid permease [Haladaptatus sp. AB618]